MSNHGGFLLVSAVVSLCRLCHAVAIYDIHGYVVVGISEDRELATVAPLHGAQQHPLSNMEVCLAKSSELI